MCLTDIYGDIRTKKLTVRQKDGGSNTLFRYVLLNLCGSLISQTTASWQKDGYGQRN